MGFYFIDFGLAYYQFDEKLNQSEAKPVFYSIGGIHAWNRKSSDAMQFLLLGEVPKILLRALDFAPFMQKSMEIHFKLLLVPSSHRPILQHRKSSEIAHELLDYFSIVDVTPKWFHILMRSQIVELQHSFLCVTICPLQMEIDNEKSYHH